jgi:energy-coupling factor transport system permease protein
MRFTQPVADQTAPLARRNPTAKLAAAMVLTLLLVVSLDPVTPAVALAVELAVLPLFGLRYRALLGRAWPLLAAAGAAGLSYVFFGQRAGEVVVMAGSVTVTTGVLTSALSLILRLLAVALPSVAVFATTDPTDLADSLVQNVGASPRFVIGSVAAVRLLPLLATDWETLRMARRARGVDAGRSPIASVRLLVSTTFSLLVLAVRRGTRLAAAMDARGFNAGVPRSVARPQRFGAADGLLVAAALVTGALAIAASVALGTFNPLFS